MFESARAYAAADARDVVTVADLEAVAPMALRLRHSAFIEEFFAHQQVEDQRIGETFEQIRGEVNGEN